MTPTERLKAVNASGSRLARMNSRMSGWSTRRTAMFAPRLIPPCLITSVAVLKTRMNETGPDALPPVVATRSSRGRRRENENPVPPPTGE